MKRSLLVFALFLSVVVIPIGLVVIGVMLSGLHSAKVQPGATQPADRASAVAARYAPVFLQELPQQGLAPAHWDYLCAMNFDGDWNPLNNLQNLEAEPDGQQWQPTVYYSLLETKSHFFITYTLFHPLEWSQEAQHVRKSYENDIKTLQLVVKKDNKESSQGTIWLVAIQAHESVKFYKLAHARMSMNDTETKFETVPIVLANEMGVPITGGTHPVIVIAQGHHYLGMPEERPDLFQDLGRCILKQGLTYLPIATSPLQQEPQRPTKAYHLDDIYETMWSKWREHAAQFTIQSFFDYEDALLAHEAIPLYLANQPLEGTKSTLPNPNILPFAFGKGLHKNSQGRFFFNPVDAYRNSFEVHQWSLVYLFHPYAAEMAK